MLQAENVHKICSAQNTSAEEKTLADNHVTMKQPSRKCCKMNYRVRYFYSKGAFLVILWTALVSAAMAQLSSGPNEMHSFVVTSIYLTCAFILVFICTPLIGWLADAKFGNLKVFKVGLILIFVSATVGRIGKEIITEYQSIPKDASEVYNTINTFIGVIGTVICFVTSLQLGLDQMPDASTDNLSSFIAWFVFSMSFGLWMSETLPNAIWNCVNENEALETSISFIPPICMTVACCTMFILAPRYLVVEPKAPQSLKTIYKVLRFAAKHKSPLNRSALTYWEEDIPSQLDLGKSRYGGPFTTEQVEDVKTFFKLLTMLIPIFLISFAVPTIHRGDKPPLETYSECITDTFHAFTSDLWWSSMAAILLYEFILFPLARNKLPNTLKQVGTAALLLLIIKCLFIGETVVDMSDQSTNYTEGLQTGLLFNIQCWVNVLLSFLYASTITIALDGMLGFVCAQSPYNMRGLLTGCTILAILSSVFFGNEMLYLVQRLVEQKHVNIIFQCTSTATGLVGVILYCVLARWYKMRVRDEDYSPHRVVEEIYDRYLSHVH